MQILGVLFAGSFSAKWAEFPLYHTKQNLSIVKLHKNSSFIFPKFVQFDYCKIRKPMLYYYYSKGEDTPSQEKNFKKIKKSVDKLKKVWYNKDTVRELRKSTKKIFKKV